MSAALTALVLVLAMVGTSSAAAPTLRVTDTTPLVVRGSGFKTGETVKVALVLTTSRRYRAATVGRTGSFTVRFSLAPIQCHLARALVATGSRGSRASRPLQLECMPPPPLAP